MKNIIKPDEMQILKAQLVELDSDTVLLATYQYHTEKIDTADGTKNDRTKSRYRWLARVMKKTDYNQAIMDLMQDSKRLERFHWWDDPTWDGYIMTHDSTNSVIAAFLKIKMKKIHSWEEGQKIFNGWTNATKLKAEGYNLSAKYEIDGYTTASGETVSLSDREALLKLVNQNLSKEIFSKAKLKSMSKEQQPKENEAKLPSVEPEPARATA